ncbi:MAG: nuclease [Deltaproteobacteria bacterium]|nr:MAG: nuclease [Deltaproteobacteria bacterium]
MFISISGTFHVTGYNPDGDSLHFQALNADNWGRLRGRPVRLNRQGQAQLRLEGIDALELNYEGWHQPLKYAREALDFLLSHLRIRGNLFGPSHARDGAAGYILARHAEKNRRPVAFVFAGDPPWPDGEKVFLDAALVRQSVNYLLLQEGLVYPTYYEGLYADLREELTRGVQAARRERLGLWPRDCSNSGVTMDEGQAGLEKCVILPKLFRRLVRFIKENRDISGFKDYLDATPDPAVHLPTGRLTGLADLVEVRGNAVKLLAAPEDLVFKES